MRHIRTKVLLLLHFILAACERDGMYRDDTDCSAYFQCSGGHRYRQICPYGTAFNPKTETCGYDTTVCKSKVGYIDMYMYRNNHDHNIIVTNMHLQCFMKDMTNIYVLGKRDSIWRKITHRKLEYFTLRKIECRC